jgi:hypothetical protein
MEDDDRQCFLTDEESQAMVFIPPVSMLTIPLDLKSGEKGLNIVNSDSKNISGEGA